MIKVIEGEYDEWQPIYRIADDATIADGVQVISCDTRDFALGWQFEQPESYSHTDCNHDRWCNEGLGRLKNLLLVKNNTKYMIDQKDIITWLQSLAIKSGGMQLDWRCIESPIEGCDGWKLKYIRFVRNPKIFNQFIVCNAYYRPIKWQEICDSIKTLHE